MQASDGLPPADCRRDHDLICEVAQQAGRMALEHFTRGGHTVTWKGGVSPVTAADMAVDKYLRETLRAARPDYGWLSEETADTAVAHRMAAPRTFVVDPIDGTRGFIEGRPQWCISIAVVEAGRPVAAVLECPAIGETFAAEAGRGASLNGQPLKLAALSGAPAVVAGPKPVVDRHVALAGPVERHPHVPSLAYRIALVAAGRLDGTYVRPAANDWDVAAADLVLAQAGGRLCDAAGKDLVYNGPLPRKDVMIAGHPALLPVMLAVVGG